MAAAFSAEAEAKPAIIAFPVGDVVFVSSMNNNGVIAGFGQTGQQPAEGFVRMPDGTIEMFSVPVGRVQGTRVASINDDGAVTGIYYVKNHLSRLTPHAYVRDVSGTITTFRVPGAAGGEYPVKITPDGTIFGTAGLKDDTGEGFKRTADGTITTFMCHCASTYVSAANNLGAVTGTDTNGKAFIRAPDGSFTYFTGGGRGVLTPTAMNDQGVVTGTVYSDGKVTAFVRDVDGALKFFNIRNSVGGVFPMSINAAGTITGSYIDPSDTEPHGFVRTATGTITRFDPKGSGSTYPTSIDDSGAIAGYYTSRKLLNYGFLRAPD